MLQVIDKEAVYRQRILKLLHQVLQSDNMSLHDFEDIYRQIHILRSKLNVIRNEKAKYTDRDVL